MGKRMLLSAIGGNDPISGCRDGALLHICRTYKPDVVYLYLSKKMLEYHKKDDRYQYCLNKLGELLNHHFEIKLIEKNDLKNVQVFDTFYYEFETIIKDIMKEEDVEILLNVSSGTPAMKSAFQVLATLSEHKLMAIQVSTPAGDINTHIEDREHYDVELQWACNEDNESGYINRCTVSECENLLVKFKKEMLIKYCNVYDYEAAYRLGESIKEFIDPKGLNLLKMACCRVQLDHSRISTLEPITKEKILVQLSKNIQELVEYILVLQIKLRRKEYVDFIRGLTPVIVDLFEVCLRNKCDIDIKNYCTIRQRNGNSVYYIDRRKLETNEAVKSCLDEEFSRGCQEMPYTSVHLKALLMTFCEDQAIRENVECLRNIEEIIRNIAAHEIVSVTEAWIKQRLNQTPEQILKALKKMVGQAGLNVPNNLWGDYERMNERIKAVIN